MRSQSRTLFKGIYTTSKRGKGNASGTYAARANRRNRAPSKVISLTNGGIKTF